MLGLCQLDSACADDPDGRGFCPPARPTFFLAGTIRSDGAAGFLSLRVAEISPPFYTKRACPGNRELD